MPFSNPLNLLVKILQLRTDMETPAVLPTYTVRVKLRLNLLN